MALKRNYITKSGVAVAYWKLSNFSPVLSQKIMNIELVPYVSDRTRQDGYEPVFEEKRMVRVNRQNFEEYFSPEALNRNSQKNFYEVIYQFVKEQDEFFQNAQDC